LYLQELGAALHGAAALVLPSGEYGSAKLLLSHALSATGKVLNPRK